MNKLVKGLAAVVIGLAVISARGAIVTNVPLDSYAHVEAMKLINANTTRINTELTNDTALLNTTTSAVLGVVVSNVGVASNLAAAARADALALSNGTLRAGVATVALTATNVTGYSLKTNTVIYLDASTNVATNTTIYLGK